MLPTSGMRSKRCPAWPRPRRSPSRKRRQRGGPLRSCRSRTSMNAILTQEPDLSQPGRSVPAGLERIVRRCLEKDPARRFQNAADLGYAIEAVSGLAATPPQSVAEEAETRRSVAVLPFKDLAD